MTPTLQGPALGLRVLWDSSESGLMALSRQGQWLVLVSFSIVRKRRGTASGDLLAVGCEVPAGLRGGQAPHRSGFVAGDFALSNSAEHSSHAASTLAAFWDLLEISVQSTISGGVSSERASTHINSLKASGVPERRVLVLLFID